MVIVGNRAGPTDHLVTFWTHRTDAITTLTRVPRLLLVAPTIDRSDVGEAWVAYQWASRLAERHDLTVLTYTKHGAPSARDQLPGAEVVEWAEPPLLHRAERFNSILKPGYPIFQRRARRWIAEAVRSGRTFDLAHQVTPVAMRYPTPLAGSGIPYLLGPLGGSLTSPPGFSADEGTAPWYVGLRRIDSWRLAHDPELRRGLTGAAVVLGIAPYVADLLKDVSVRRFEILSETGLVELPDPVVREERSGTVRLLYVGRLVRTKGARDAVRALSAVADLDIHLDVIGNGPDRAACETEAQALGVADRVTFHGRMPRAAIDAYYRDADVFVFPSYREAGGNVQYEAMSFGLPLVVSSRGGTAAAVTPECAILVDAIDPDQFARDLAAAIRGLTQDPARRLAMGDQARRHAEATGLWDRKVDAIDAMYESVIRSA